MKITLTGWLGNLSKPLAEILIKNGHDITLSATYGQLNQHQSKSRGSIKLTNFTNEFTIIYRSQQ
jgi:hypothetical protein